ncbi:MFS transporter [Nonomuraea turcica]|uniref:MFS transporter n=1 Tax=Nonomuraea sp. G32 TaxID=3067274 RepID=UPI00273B7042|nr:MFS transporter [Nonomuraea sp. G32]MDP4505324.1 MFS transporter [Nonomuraea sp. G32]
MATYREVFAVREFRALLAAQLLSLAGDQLSKVAVSLLVFGSTGSAMLAAVAFGVSYLPWVVIGPVLAALADRFPRRTVMISCDVARAVLVTTLAVPGLPVAVQVAVLFAASIFTPPALAARSATMSEVLHGDAYVVGSGISSVSAQLAEVIGLAAGSVLLSLVSPRGVLLADAMTFALSATLLTAFVVRRPAAPCSERTTVLRDTAHGLRMILTSRRLRSFVMLAWVGAAFTTAPEGLMTAYAAYLHSGHATYGLLLAAMPFGAVCGAIVYGRFTTPASRWRLVPGMALLSCASMLPIFADPPLPIVLTLLSITGYGTAFQIALNARFIQEVPASHRGRAYGVAMAGLMVGMCAATAGAGALSDLWQDPPLVIGLCGLAGLLAMAPLLVRWPSGIRSAPGNFPGRSHGVEQDGGS